MISYNSKGRSIVAGRKIIFHRNSSLPRTICVSASTCPLRTVVLYCSCCTPAQSYIHTYAYIAVLLQGVQTCVCVCVRIMLHVYTVLCRRRRPMCLILHIASFGNYLTDGPEQIYYRLSVIYARGRCFVSSVYVNYRKSGTLVLNHATDNPIILR